MATSSKYNFVDLTVENCFSKYYIIPDYQREYVWESDKQVIQLLTDVYEAYCADNKKEYFIGTTVVYNNNGNNELIDGQQRTTTLFLILCAFKNLYTACGLDKKGLEQCISNSTYDDEGNEVYKYHLELQYDESSQILERIDKETISLDETVETNSSERLVKAYYAIKQFIQENTDNNTDELKRLFIYFFRKLKFIQISTPDINDALKIFETINDRGIGLSPMDLLKNLIFRQIGRDNFYKIKAKWKILVDTLEQNKEKTLRFLRYFIMSNYPSVENGVRKDENVVREDEIYTWFVQHADLCGYEKEPIKFVDLLLENANCYVNFAKGKDVKGNYNVNLCNIINLGGQAFKQHIITLLSVRNFQQEMFDYLCKNIETYLFYFLFTKEQAKIFEKQFAKWNLILKDVRTMDQLKNFVTVSIKPEIEGKQDEYKSRFLLFSQGDLQTYRIRYMLAKITQYVDLCRKGIYTSESISPYLSRGVEIEHILPQTPFSEEMYNQFENYDRAKKMFGNLTLIEKSMNGVVKNKPYEEKVVDYGKSPYYLTSSLFQLDKVGINSAINKISTFLQPFDKWNMEAINRRQQLLYELSLEIWKIE